METIKMGKRGTLVVPAKIRKQFGLDEGSLLITETRDGEIRLRPAVAVGVEIYTPERKAEFLLNNAITQEDWDAAAEEIRGWGLDPLKILNTDPDERKDLMTRAELDRRFAEREARKHQQQKTA